MPRHLSNSAIAVTDIDIGKTSFRVVGHDQRGATMLRQKWSRGKVEARPANLPPWRAFPNYVRVGEPARGRVWFHGLLNVPCATC